MAFACRRPPKDLLHVMKTPRAWRLDFCEFESRGAGKWREGNEGIDVCVKNAYRERL